MSKEKTIQIKATGEVVEVELDEDIYYEHGQHFCLPITTRYWTEDEIEIIK
jgi:hypothetical protein